MGEGRKPSKDKFQIGRWDISDLCTSMGNKSQKLPSGRQRWECLSTDCHPFLVECSQGTAFLVVPDAVEQIHDGGEGPWVGGVEEGHRQVRGLSNITTAEARLEGPVTALTVPL